MSQVVRFLNTRVGDLRMVKREVEGFKYGIELELEGCGVALRDVATRNWLRVEEGSLRGENIEYVFSTPGDFIESQKRVDALFRLFKKHNVALKNSYRTSTHVHLNFCDKSVKQAINFFLLHTVVEEILQYYCGDQRTGNLFCLSCRDNENLLELLDDAVFKHQTFEQFNDHVRYNAANLASLRKFQTIEIRTMRGADSAEQVKQWLDILRQLYEYSCREDCPPPWKLCENLSYLGVEGFLGQFFTHETVEALLKTWPAALNIHESLLNGVRLVQMLAYKLEEDWDKEYEPEKFQTLDKMVIVDHGPNMVRWDVGGMPAPPPGMAPLINRKPPAEQSDKIFIPHIGQWFVLRRDQLGPVDNHRQNIGARGFLQFSRELDYWMYQTGAAEEFSICRWLTYKGINLRQGTALENEINRQWYDENEPEEPEDGYEPDFDEDQDHEED